MAGVGGGEGVYDLLWSKERALMVLNHLLELLVLKPSCTLVSLFVPILQFLKNITFMNIIITAISTGKYKLILQ